MSCATLPRCATGRRFTVPLLAVTSPQVKPDCGSRRLHGSASKPPAAHVLSGMCFYQSYAREIAEANGWKRLATNSAKLVNILGGYGYVPMLASMEACVDAAAETGRLQAGMTVFRARHAMGAHGARRPRWSRNDGFSARYDLDRIAGMFSRPAHKLAGQSYVGQDPGARHREGRRRERLDAARDDVARDRAAGDRVELGEPDPGAGRGARRYDDARRLRARTSPPRSRTACRSR